jgi:hypothetical protein
VTKEYSKGSTQLPGSNNVPSLSLKLIGKSILEGALFAQTTLQAFKYIVALTLFANFQLIVNLFLNPNPPAARNFFRDKLGALAFKSRFGLKQLSYSKISFVLGKDCNIFCEVVGEVVIGPPPLTNVSKYGNEVINQQLTHIFDDDSNSVGS